MNTIETVRVAATAALSKKAEDIKVHNLHEISSVTDYFLICTGSTNIHCKAIHEGILDALKKQDIRPWHVEGISTGRWILMDYVDFVVHIFQPEVRMFYDLESIWGDASVEVINDEIYES